MALTPMEFGDSTTTGTMTAGTNVTISGLSLRKNGNVCTLTGYAAISNGQTIAGTNATILTLPAGYRPSSAVLIVVYTHYGASDSMVTCAINTDGTIKTSHGSQTLSGNIYFFTTYLIS